MNVLFSRARLGLGSVAALVLLAGCASDPDRYYTLSAPPPAAGLAAPAPAQPGLAIEIGPVAVPERLARPQMVLRRGGADVAQLQVLEQHRWASSFEQELRDALSAAVAQRLGAADVSRAGRVQGQTVWRASVQVQAFDAVPAEQVSARLQWRLRRPDGSDAGACGWSGSEPVGAQMEAVAQGAQRLTARAAEALAQQIAALQGGAALRCQQG
ncbi:LPS assembly lipoprotein LptE [Xenophilus arseniciresistens]|uniref:LPS assembly lipoprotein LptE n=1 Tax=Xenophilus arseniciresistens TaxID=1283306 RepID=A0AAE3NB25_9BURK|nr:ABC-type transport auxiliary lipoprotein family protein [Xenophilus arseniciresistens]MDA7417611.1 LPS assembly lipoprotein LptE [Xenophilus arseniciresistens]